MNTWAKSVVTAAALLTGCTGTISDPGGTAHPTGSGGVPGGPPGSGGISGTGAAPATPSACSPGVPGTTRMPLLTNSQYDNTVQELFGLGLSADTLPSSMLAPDDTGGSVDQRTWTGFQGA